MKKPVVLCILDGCGLSSNEKDNAFHNAHKKTYNYLKENYPFTTLYASGPYVGLPENQMGNSEVGHMNIGAGSIVYQPQERINKSIRTGEFFQNEQILSTLKHVKENSSNLHIMGLISDGGIHSDIKHLFALIDLCQKENVENVYFDLFTDGRDTDIHSAKKYLAMLEEKIKETNIGTITTISGRYYAMDRDNNYDRLKLAYGAIVKNEGPRFKDYQELLNYYYENNITDEFIIPSIIEEHAITDNDCIIIFNYRPDRLREISLSLTNPQETPLETLKLNNLKFTSMMPIHNDVIGTFAFNLTNIENPLGLYIDLCGLNQLRIAETEKYAHVTYFFDGGKELTLKHANRILIPSKKVATYDEVPKMSAEEITENLLNELQKDYLDFVVLNFANGDMLGHTGNYEAAKEGIEYVDTCLAKIYEVIKEKDGILIVTADHGNCERMRNEDGTICTTHTTNKVPFIITKSNLSLKDGGSLCDIAPTILELLSLEVPKSMSGTSLIKE